jgi:hypothetical protein
LKWIGQHIWDFISRFRSDVYFEAVPDGTIASGKNLGLDSDNKLVKESDAGITDLHGAGVDGAANQLLTDDGDGTVTSEANFTFDGTDLLLDSTGGLGTYGSNVLHLKNSNAAVGGPGIRFQKIGKTGASGDLIGQMNWQALNDADSLAGFANVQVKIDDASGAGTGQVIFSSTTKIVADGGVTGNVTGNVTGSSGSCTGNAVTASTATNVVVTDDENSDTDHAITFVDDLDGSAGLGLESDGDFHYNPSTGKVTATLFSGTFSGTATNSNNIYVINEATDTTCFPLFTRGASGYNGPNTNANLTYNSNTGAFGSTSFVGALTGNASTATALETTRALQVTLSETDSSNFDGSAAVTDIGVTGVLAVANGGTGVNSLAADSIITGNGTNAVVAEAYLTYNTTDEELIIGNPDNGDATISRRDSSGTDTAGGNLIIQAGPATGDAQGGSIKFNSSTAGGSGSTVQNPKEVAIIDSSGHLTLGEDNNTTIAIKRSSFSDNGGRLNVKGGDSTGTNKNGGGIIFDSGQGTGTGVGGNFTFRSHVGGSSGSSPNSLGEIFKIDNLGGITYAGGNITSDARITLNSAMSMYFKIDDDNNGTENFKWYAYNTEIANLDESGNLQIDGRLTESTRTRIKILPSDFIADDGGRPVMIDDTGSDRWLESHGTLKMYASIEIPTGYTATECAIYGSDTSAITVYEADINSKTVTSKGTGNIGTAIDGGDFTNVASDTTNYLLIELAQASGEEVYGGYVTIAVT